jgi:hypothetical protein
MYTSRSLAAYWFSTSISTKATLISTKATSVSTKATLILSSRAG